MSELTEQQVIEKARKVWPHSRFWLKQVSVHYPDGSLVITYWLHVPGHWPIAAPTLRELYDAIPESRR